VEQPPLIACGKMLSMSLQWQIEQTNGRKGKEKASLNSLDIQVRHKKMKKKQEMTSFGIKLVQ